MMTREKFIAMLRKEAAFNRDEANAYIYSQALRMHALGMATAFDSAANMMEGMIWADQITP